MITQANLKESLYYDPETGVFTWLHRPSCHFKRECDQRTFNTKYAGKVAGSTNAHGYIQIMLFGVNELAHRLAFIYMNGKSPEIIDHLDGDRSNNQFTNIRPASKSENNRNSLVGKNNKSGFKGVYWSKCANKWAAQIVIDKSKKYLGLFSCPEEAAKRYDKEAMLRFGEFAKTNKSMGLL